jgi:hypothetical protein
MKIRVSIDLDTPFDLTLQHHIIGQIIYYCQVI